MLAILALAVPRQGDVLDPLTVVLSDVRKTLLAHADAPAWGVHRDSWGRTWDLRSVMPEFASARSDKYRFRIAPDWDREVSTGISSFLVEAYRDGFPVCAVRRDGHVGEPSRPLGVVYDADGEPTNADPFVFKDGRWSTPKLTERGKSALLGCLAFSKPTPDLKQGVPWFRVVVAGYGTYIVDRGLKATGPGGAHCLVFDYRFPDGRSMIQGILDGKANEEAKRSRP